MTKVVFLAEIIALVAAGPTAASAASPSRTEATARVQIISSNEVIVLRPNSAAAEDKGRETSGLTASRSVSKRQVRLDANGRVIQGEANVQFITIDVH